MNDVDVCRETNRRLAVSLRISQCYFPRMASPEHGNGTDMRTKRFANETLPRAALDRKMDVLEDRCSAVGDATTDAGSPTGQSARKYNER